MESTKSLFTLEVDAEAKSHLKDAAKWAKFLAIVGFIALGLILIITCIVSIRTHNSMVELYGEGSAGRGEMIGSIVAASFFVVIYFFPCFFSLRFANKMQAAINADDAASLNDAFKNLKITFRYVGIITIIFLALFVIGLLTELASN